VPLLQDLQAAPKGSGQGSWALQQLLLVLVMAASIQVLLEEQELEQLRGEGGLDHLDMQQQTRCVVSGVHSMNPLGQLQWNCCC
jgi:hypothetical protein